MRVHGAFLTTKKTVCSLGVKMKNKMSLGVVVVFGGALLTLSQLAFSQSTAPQNVKYLAANCANCHGTNGAGSKGLPSLAGLEKEYIIEQMKNFKSGAREATLMHQISKGYTDEQVAAMAAFFEQQKR